ncbi:MAG: hypothetical protein GOV00_00830 [Candidatus Altiarchaeota archaeon]|nr:hypothetical protein [Candidatus Altiarchaeota archaeon]
MRGLGVPEIIISVGLLLVLLAGFLPGGTNVRRNEILLLSQDVGNIGSGDFTYKHISLTSNLVLAKGVEGTPLITQSGTIEVAKGLLTTQEHTVRFSVPTETINDLDSATILLTIENTNRYGPLMITVNGEEIFKEVPEENSLEIKIPLNILETENSIRISAGSSGWKIWAPTVYELSELKVVESLATNEMQSFQFSIEKDDLEDFYLGRVYVGSMQPQIAGELTIILNNENVVYRGMPGTGAFMTTFASGIKEENSIEFKLLEEGYYEMKNVEVIIFTQANASSVFTTEFSITPVDLAKLRDGTVRGVIELDISLASEDLLRIILSAESDTTLYELPAEEGKLELGFSEMEAASQNRLVIESPGAYEIESVKVKLVK